MQGEVPPTLISTAATATTTTTTSSIENTKLKPSLSSSSSIYSRQQLTQQQQQHHQYLHKQHSLDEYNTNESEFLNLSTSTISSSSKLNNNNSNKRGERLQDPFNMLKKTLIRSNELNNRSENDNLSEQQKQQQNILQKQYSSSSSSSLTQASTQTNDSKQQKPTQKTVSDTPLILTTIATTISKTISSSTTTTTSTITPTISRYPQRIPQLLHTDSLSSDPSECMSQRNSICLPSNTILMQTKYSNNNNNNNKRTTSDNAFSNPPAPTPITTIATEKKTIMTQDEPQLSSIMSTEDVIKNVNIDNNSTIMQQKNHQNSPQSSSKLIGRIKRLKIKANKQQHSLSSSDEYDEFDDEEIRSTTEYTTNDEMEIESGSLSEKGVYTRKIDDYLEQNLGKEEILAAKMKKFLNVINLLIKIYKVFLII